MTITDEERIKQLEELLLKRSMKQYPLDNFVGRDDERSWDRYWKHFEMVKNRNLWTDEEAVRELKLALKQDAEVWLLSLPGIDSITLQELEVSAKGEFCGENFEKMMERKLTRQEGEETVEAYLLRFTGTAQKISKTRMTEEKKVELLLDGVRGQLGTLARFQVRNERATGKNINLQRAVEVVRECLGSIEPDRTSWEGRREQKPSLKSNLEKNKNKAEPKETKDSERLENRMQDLGKKFQQLALYVGKKVKEQPRTGACYVCVEMGHFARDHYKEEGYLADETYLGERKRMRKEEFEDMEAQEVGTREQREKTHRIAALERLKKSKDERGRKFMNGRRERTEHEPELSNPTRKITFKDDKKGEIKPRGVLKPIPLMKGEKEYSIQDILKKTPSEITLGQLMQVSPKMRSELMASVRATRRTKEDEEAKLLEQMLLEYDKLDTGGFGLKGEEEEFFAETVESDGEEEDFYIEEEETMLSSRTPKRPQRGEVMGKEVVRGAPRAIGSLINGRKVAVIIDGGSYSNIINHGVLLETEWIGKIKTTTVTLVMADGSRTEPLGKIEGFPIYFGDRHVKVNALVMKEPAYSILLGRKFLIRMRVITDWERNQFIMRDDAHGRIRLPMGTKDDEERPINEKVKIEKGPINKKDVSSYFDGYLNDLVETVTEDRITRITGRVDGLIQNLKRDINLGLDMDQESYHITGEALKTSAEREKYQSQKLLEEIERKLQEMAPRFKASYGGPLKELLNEYRDVLALGIEDVKRPADFPPLELELKPGARPIRKRAYRLPPEMVQDMKKFVYELWKNGLVEPCRGEWGFEMFGVPKPGGGTRWVVNFKPLNEVIEGDGYPLPRMEDLRDRLQGSVVYTALDFLSGFHQGPVGEKSQKYFSFITPFGQFRYKVLPMGPKPIPAHFQRCMDATFSNMNAKVEVYIDDLTTHAKDGHQHLKDIREILQRCRDVHLMVGLKKCHFFQEEIRMLGMKVNAEGISLDETIKGKIQAFKAPRNRTELKSFLGLCGFNRDHVERFAERTWNMNQLLKQSMEYRWGEMEQKEFDEMKKLMTTSPVLRYPDFEKEFIVRTDASKYALAGILCQKGDDGKEHVVRYWSKTVPKRLKDYAAFELECMAVIGALRAFKHYLLGKPFDLFCDNRALVELLKRDNWTGKLARWTITIQEYEFRIHHVKGKLNWVTDAMSRLPIEEEEEEMFQEDDYEVYHIEEEIQETDTVGRIRVKDLWEALSGTENHELVKRRMDATEVQRLKSQMDRFQRIEHSGKLMRRTIHGWKEYVPVSKRQEVMEEVHDGSGHFGVNATFDRLKARYWWPQYYEDIRNWIRSCEACQKEATRTKVEASSGSSVEEIFDRWAVDFVGPIECNDGEARYILSCVEYVTRWPEVKVMKQPNAENFCDAFYELVISRFGPPTTILSDNGPEFRSQLTEQLMKRMNIRHLFSSPYNPTTNGLVEHFNGVFWRMIRKSMDLRSNWWDYIHTYLYNYRVKMLPGETFSPFQLMYGVSNYSGAMESKEMEHERSKVVRSRLRSLLKLRNDRNGIIEKKKMLAEKLNERAKRRNRLYEVGQAVDILNPRLIKGQKLGKTEDKWIGPYQIIKVGANGQYVVGIKPNDEGYKLNQRLLRPHTKRT